jgi:hypothetical protein
MKLLIMKSPTIPLPHPSEAQISSSGPYSETASDKKHKIYIEGYRIYGNFTTDTRQMLFHTVDHCSPLFQF